MTDLRILLDQAAGEEPAITDDDLAADLRRGQRGARRRQYTASAAGVAATALVIAGWWALLPEAEPSGMFVEPGVAITPSTTLSAEGTAGHPSRPTPWPSPPFPHRAPMTWAARPVPLVKDGIPVPKTNVVCDLKPKGWQSWPHGPNAIYYRDPTSTYPHTNPPRMHLGWEVGDGTRVIVGPFGDKVGTGWQAQVNAHIGGKEAAVFSDVQQGKNRPLEIFVRLDVSTTVQVGIGPRSGWDRDDALKFAASCHYTR